MKNKARYINFSNKLDLKTIFNNINSLIEYRDTVKDIVSLKKGGKKKYDSLSIDEKRILIDSKWKKINELNQVLFPKDLEDFIPTKNIRLKGPKVVSKIKIDKPEEKSKNKIKDEEWDWPNEVDIQMREIRNRTKEKVKNGDLDHEIEKVRNYIEKKNEPPNDLIDDEAVIMNALKNREGDRFGY